MIPEYLQFVINNGVGVFFGFLLYQMANNSIKENTKVLIKLEETMLKMAENLDKLLNR